MNQAHNIYLVSLVALFMILGSCTVQEKSKSPTKNPTFEWFQYEGQDPVYQDINLNDDQYLNPIIAGFYPDPSIVRVGEDYYMVHSSFSYYPGIPIFHSKDLVNWTQIGHVLDRPSQLNLDSLRISRGVFAPTIEYHDGTFYVMNTLVDAGGNFMVTASDPSGPWSDPIWLPRVGGIDPSIFFDDDGKVYVLNNDAPKGEPLYEGHRALWMHELDLEAKKVKGESKVIVDGGTDISKEPIWIEAPHLLKINGEYLLHAAEGGTGPDHSQVAFKSSSPWGPYTPYEGNPILTQRHLDPDRPYPVAYTGHADIVQTQNGDWWAVFLGVRPYEDQFFNTGRETFLLPVEWKNGWPIILEGQKTVPYVQQKPDLQEQAKPEVPTSGNFTYREEFEQEELSHYWTFIRTVRDKWYNLDAEAGALTIEARADHISGLGQPSYIGRRQQHAHATASTSMRYKPEREGDAAGLVAFQNRNHYFFLGITMNEEGKPVIQLEKKAGGSSEIVASSAVELEDGNPVYLRVDAKGKYYDFYYGFEPGTWTLLKEEADGTILSTQTAGGFVGVTIGMYAYSEN